MQPAVEDDGLLFHDFEEDEEPTTSDALDGANNVDLLQQLQVLRDENHGLRQALMDLTLATVPEELQRDLLGGGVHHTSCMNGGVV